MRTNTVAAWQQRQVNESKPKAVTTRIQLLGRNTIEIRSYTVDSRAVCPDYSKQGNRGTPVGRNQVYRNFQRFTLLQFQFALVVCTGQFKFLDPVDACVS